MRISIALLVVVATMAGCGGGSDEAKDAAIAKALDAYKNAMTLYHDKHQHYLVGDAQTMMEELDREGFLDGVDTGQVDDTGRPLDDYGHPIKLDGDKDQYTIVSPGANGIFGDADDIKVSSGN